MLWLGGFAAAFVGMFVGLGAPDGSQYAAVERLGFLIAALGWGSTGYGLVRYRDALAAVEGHPRSVYGSSTTTNVLTSVPLFWFASAFAAGAVL